ncbi:unnamed protein product, partial [marine sediment metagenome]
HGVNCMDGFGSGIARQIAKEYPNSKEVYHENSPFSLGKVIGTPDGIIHCATQQFYGKSGKKYCSYDAIEDCMKYVNKIYKGKKIGLPKIGAGLGGGNWNIIAKIIEETLTDVEYTVYVLE